MVFFGNTFQSIMEDKQPETQFFKQGDSESEEGVGRLPDRGTPGWALNAFVPPLSLSTCY